MGQEIDKNAGIESWEWLVGDVVVTGALMCSAVQNNHFYLPVWHANGFPLSSLGIFLVESVGSLIYGVAGIMFAIKSLGKAFFF